MVCIFRLWAAVALGLLLGASVRAEVTFAKVVDTNDGAPGAAGLFWQFDIASQHNGNVAFTARAGNVEGVYARMSGTLIRIADTSMVAPGGDDTFRFFGSTAIDQGKIAFVAHSGPDFDPNRLGGGLHDGVFQWSNGQLTKIAGLDTPPPDEPGSFAWFHHAAEISGDTILFTAERINPARFILCKHRDGMPLETVVDGLTTVPGRTTTFQRLIGGGIDGENVAFFGTDYEGRDGIYAVIDGQVQTIADSETDFPGATEPFSGFFQRPDIDGTDVAVPTFGGVYARLNGTLVRIADRTTTAPGTSETFQNFVGYAAIDNGAVAFVARTASDHVGVYYGNGTELRTVADSTSLFSGQEASSMAIRPVSFHEGRLAFRVIFAGNILDDIVEGGIYLADGVTFSAEGSSISLTQKHLVTSTGAFQSISYNYSTSALHQTPYDLAPATFTSPLTPGSWSGVFLYDYTSARFSEALYQLQLALDNP